VLENRTLRKMFYPKTAEVSGGWRKLRDEELHTLHSWPRTIKRFKGRRMKWAEYVGRMWERSNASRIPCENRMKSRRATEEVRGYKFLFVCNPILFTICTSTFGKLCKNVYNEM
jgi:hypothetical protein